VAELRGAPDDATFPFWSGGVLSLRAAMWLLVGERVVHGWDIAKGLGRDWPIDRADAAGVIDGALEAAPLLLDPDAAAGLRASFDVRVRGFTHYLATLDDGLLDISRTAPDAKADVHVSGDPVALLLVSYGRVRWWRPALRGRITTWGRRPLLGLTFPKLLRNP
jgi:hypothetical protein